MKLIIVGCEYAGATTLASKLHEWSHEHMDVGFPIVHDHWKVPHVWGHPAGTTQLKGMTPEERQQVMALSPRLKEASQRQNLFYHIFPPDREDEHYLAVGLHIEDAIYAPLYFNYGIKGEFDVDRSIVQEIVEHKILRFTPEMTLVLVKASPEVIARRMRESPHDPSVIKEKDIELILGQFQEEFGAARFKNKIELDTSESTPEETLAELLKQYEPYFSDADRTRILVKRAKQRSDWL